MSAELIGDVEGDVQDLATASSMLAWIKSKIYRKSFYQYLAASVPSPALQYKRNETTTPTLHG